MTSEASRNLRMYLSVLNHYVVGNGALAGERSPTRTDRVIPLHRLDDQRQSPLGVLAEEYYDPSIEIMANSSAISHLRARVPRNNPIAEANTTTLLSLIDHHDYLVTNAYRRDIREGMRISAKREWLTKILGADIGTGEVARLESTRRIARLVLKDSAGV